MTGQGRVCSCGETEQPAPLVMPSVAAWVVGAKLHSRSGCKPCPSALLGRTPSRSEDTDGPWQYPQPWCADCQRAVHEGPCEPGRVLSRSTGEGDAIRCQTCRTWFTPETPEQVRCRAHKGAWRRVFSFWDLYDPEAS